MGEPVIGFQITRSRGYSDVGVATDVRDAVDAFAKEHPEVAIVEASNTVTPIEDNYHGSMSLLIEGALLADRRGLVVPAGLARHPHRRNSTSAVDHSDLLFMALAGYSLNTVTLLSLSLVVGILVDDAIVEIENIERHLRMGRTPYEAAMEAADEIGLAVIATTFTLVAVFLPTAFMDGIPGLIFRQFGVTASVAVLASLLVARLLTPMMAAYLLKPAKPGDDAAIDGPVMTRYLHWVRSALTRRRTAVIGAAVFFVLALAVLPLLPTGFIPAKDQAQSRVTLTVPPGSTLETTAATSQRAAELLRSLPEVRSVFVSAGTATTGGGLSVSAMSDVTSATLTVDLVPRDERKLKQSQVEAKMRELLRTLPGARIAVGSGASGETLGITLASDDPEALASAAAKVESELRTLEGIGDVTSSAALQRPEIQVRPDTARAASLGVTSEALADAVRLATYGDYSTTLPKLNLPERQIPIRVRMDPAVRDDLNAVSQLRVQGSQGIVSLGSVADVSMGSGPSQIARFDRSRNVTLSVELNGRSIGEVQREAMRLPTLSGLPVASTRSSRANCNECQSSFRVSDWRWPLAFSASTPCWCCCFTTSCNRPRSCAHYRCALAGALLALWITSQRSLCRRLLEYLC